MKRVSRLLILALILVFTNVGRASALGGAGSPGQTGEGTINTGAVGNAAGGVLLLFSQGVGGLALTKSQLETGDEAGTNTPGHTGISGTTRSGGEQGSVGLLSGSNLRGVPLLETGFVAPGIGGAYGGGQNSGMLTTGYDVGKNGKGVNGGGDLGTATGGRQKLRSNLGQRVIDGGGLLIGQGLSDTTSLGNAICSGAGTTGGIT